MDQFDFASLSVAMLVTSQPISGRLYTRCVAVEVAHFPRSLTLIFSLDWLHCGSG